MLDSCTTSFPYLENLPSFSRGSWLSTFWEIRRQSRPVKSRASKPAAVGEISWSKHVWGSRLTYPLKIAVLCSFPLLAAQAVAPDVWRLSSIFELGNMILMGFGSGGWRRGGGGGVPFSHIPIRQMYKYKYCRTFPHPILLRIAYSIKAVFILNYNFSI
jgi:hypothetical protein